MAGDGTEQLSADMTRFVLAKLAPEELPIYKELRHTEIPAADSTKAGGHEEILGFGFGLILAPLAPYIWQVVESLVPMLMTEAAGILHKEAHDATEEVVRRRLRALFRLDGAPSPMPPAANDGQLVFTAEQTKAVRNAALEKARDLDLDEKKASLMADAIVGALERAA